MLHSGGNRLTDAVASLLVVLLSHAGYWFGGQDGSVTAQWAVKADAPAAQVSWELMLGGARLDGGNAALGPGDGERGAPIRVRPPVVRARTSMRWVYRVTAQDGGAELARGDVPVDVFPDDLLDGLAQRVAAAKTELVVWDAADGALPALLARAKVPNLRVDGAGPLQVRRTPAVLVGPGALRDSSPFAQSMLMRQASAGANVFVFAQDKPQRLMGYELTPRKRDARVTWRAEHALLREFTPRDLAGLWPSEARALRLPADDASLEIAWWQPDVKGKAEPAPIDALIVEKKVGEGRLIFCQLSLDDLQHDPRAQLLVANAVDVLLTRAAPTPPLSRRLEQRPADTRPTPRITIPSGAQP